MTFSQAVKKGVVIIQLLRIKKNLVKLPVMVKVDNIEAIFMASNIANTLNIKHVDIWYKYVNKYVKDRVVKINFAKSNENNINIHMKDLSVELHKKYSKKIIGEEIK